MSSLLSRLRFWGCECGMNFWRNLDIFAEILDTSPNNLDTFCRKLDTFFNNLDTSSIHSEFLSFSNEIYYSFSLTSFIYYLSDTTSFKLTQLCLQQVCPFWNLDTFADILDTSPNNLDTICRNLDTFFNNLDTSSIHNEFLLFSNKIYYPPHSHSHPHPSSSISFSQIKNPDLSNQVEARVTLLITLY